MAIIPTVRCSRMKAAIAFYTKVLDFECVEVEVGENDPTFSVLMREGAPLFLSSHRGDGMFGQAIRAEGRSRGSDRSELGDA